MGPEAITAYTVIAGFDAPAWSYGALPATPADSRAVIDAFLGTFTGREEAPIAVQFRAAWAAQVDPILARTLASLGPIVTQSWGVDAEGQMQIRRMTFTPDADSSLTLGALQGAVPFSDKQVFLAEGTRIAFAGEDLQIILTGQADQVDFADAGFSARLLAISAGSGDDKLVIDSEPIPWAGLTGDLPDGLRLTMGDGADRTDMYARKTIWADGGTGNDWLDLALIGPAQQALTIYGGGGDDEVTAGSFLSLGGGFPQARLYGGFGKDVLIDDTYGEGRLYGGSGDDELYGGGGRDALYGGDGNDLLRDDEDASPNSLFGGAGRDSLEGGLARDSLYGGDWADSLLGRERHDWLAGGLGADTLNGGAGRDDFVFNTALSAGNIDRIINFSTVDDTIRLENAVFTGLAAGTLNAAAFRSNTTGNAGDANDRIIYERDTGKLFFDADGTGGGARKQFALLDANLTLTAADFLVF